MTEPNQGIKIVAQITGLTAHVIRIWEKRYAAVVPLRTGTNRRLYSEEQIERLKLLNEITKNGHSIANVANISTEKLRELSKNYRPVIVQPRPQPPRPPSEFIEECITAVTSLDALALEDTLKQAMIALGAQGLLQRVIAPLIHTIGKLWSVGTLTAAHEHFASAIISIFLGHAARPFAGIANAPVIVVATPIGQIHELGALLVGAAAANLGWHVVYLGPNLTAAEIAGAARQKCARAVALSLVYPGDDPRIADELKWLHELLPPEIKIIVGGRAVPDYQEALEKIDAWQVKDLTQLSSTLNELRKPAITAK